MTESKRPLKVFLCHAHADRDAVRGLYTRLTQDGVDAWLDKEKLLPGQDWELEIRKAVREADVVVVCLSKQFNQAGFRQKEVRLALDTAMEKLEGEIFIIPARLEECDNLESLRKWHWVDLFEDDGYDMLMRALRKRGDKIGTTLRIKKSRAPKKSKQEKRVFYDLTAHYEYDFENTSPEILANFLFETLTRIMRTVSGVDKTDNSRTAEYQTSQVEYLDPKNGKTTQHALIVHGKKVRYLGKGDIQGVEPLTVVPEMLIITVTQGVNCSRLRFDSNELPNDAFKNLVEWVLADIGKTVTVQSEDDSVGKVSPPKYEQPEIKVLEKQNKATLEENPIATSKPKVVRPEPKKTKPNMAIIVAIISLIVTICVALISSPILASLFSRAPVPTFTATFDNKAFIAETQTASYSIAQDQLAVTKTPEIPTLTVPSATTSLNCNKASFISETIHDGTRFSPSEKFIQVWKIRNIGTCTWTSAYSIVFQSGDIMNGPVSQSFPSNVEPGQALEISINFQAPSSPGTYQGFWMLRADSGELFFYDTETPFWIMIRVSN